MVRLFQKEKTMTDTKITPKQFDEAAWNMGLYLRWEKDENKNQKVEVDEVTPYAHTKDLFTKENAQKMIDLVLQGAGETHLGVVRSPEYIKELDAKIKGAGTKEEKRLALRDRDMAYRSWATHEIDFSKSNRGEQQAAWILLYEVFPAVEAIHALQSDPNNLNYFNEVAATGNFNDLLHLWNSGGPWCQEITDPFCNSDIHFPKREPNAGMWPKHFTGKDVAFIDKAPLSPLTKEILKSNFVDRYLEGKQLAWRPLNANPAYVPYLQVITEGLRKAAKLEGIDPTLKTFFETRANEFQDRINPYPFYNGDLAWVAVKGGLDVTLGFYEVDDSPLGMTAILQGYVGPVDAKSEGLGLKFQQLAPDMEGEVAKGLGKDYTARDFSKGLPPLRFANLVGNGDPRVKYVPGGYYLPNVPPYGDTGVYKKVFALNHQSARLDYVMQPMGDIVIHPSQRNVGKEDFSHFVVAHENAHGVGPEVGQINLAQPLRGALEEAKADQEGIASLPLAVKKGLLTQSEADKAVVAMVYGLLRGLSYGMSDHHGIGSFIEFAELYKQEGIVESEGFYKVNFVAGAVYKASQNVARRIEAIQLKSQKDPAGATEEAEKWLKASKKNLPERLKKEFLPQLTAMPKDVYPWYHFRFADAVAKDARLAKK